MLSVRYGFDTDLKRNGHATCWCPPLGALVQFGGWPPSEQLSRVIHEESSSCPLYVMPLQRILTAMRKADARRPRRGWEACMCPARICRLMRVSAALEATGAAETTTGGDQQRDHDAQSKYLTSIVETHDAVHCQLCASSSPATRSYGGRRTQGVSSHPTRATFTVSATSDQRKTDLRRDHDLRDSDDAVASESDDSDDDRRGFVYAAGYHSESYSTSFTSSEDSSDSPSSRAGNDVARADVANVASPQPAGTPAELFSDRSNASYAPPALTRALLQQHDQQDTENTRLRGRLEEIAMTMVTNTTSRENSGMLEQEQAREVDVGTTLSATLGAERREVDEQSDTSRLFGAAASMHTHTNTHRSTGTAFALQERHRQEVPPVLQDTEEIPGKQTVAPLRWRVLRPNVAPRTRHGHALIYCAQQIFLLGGSYWAHGNALASTDMIYDVARRTWSQTNSLLPARFCAATAISNARPPSTPSSSTEYVAAKHAVPLTDAQWRVDPDAVVVYAFGGLNYSRTLTSTLHRLWLPDGALEELPQYGAQPRNQFKGVLVCDVQEERSPSERRAGHAAVGRLFYMDGFQEGRPMAPTLRCYNVANSMWTRLCSSPDLTRGQLSLAQYQKRDPRSGSAPIVRGQDQGPHDDQSGADSEDMYASTYLERFDVLGGMPTRRGRQLRSRTVYSYDPAWQCFDFEHALPVPGLTAHTVTLLPAPPPLRRSRRADQSTQVPPPSSFVGHEPRSTDTVTRRTHRLRNRNAFHAFVRRVAETQEARSHPEGTSMPPLVRVDGVELSLPDAQGVLQTGAPTDARREEAASMTLLRELVGERGVAAVCVGGNEDQKNADQNNLGEPVSWLYCLGPRSIPLSECTRVSLDKQRVPYRALLLRGEHKDELLDELF